MLQIPTLVYLASAWLVGIYLGSIFRLPLAALVLSGLLFLVVLFVGRNERRVSLPAACVVFLLLGTGRYYLALHHPDEGQVDFYNGRGRITMRGLVVGEPDVRDRWTNLRIEAESLALDEQERPLRGKILAQTRRYPAYRYGDCLEIEGLLEEPPEFQDFSYKDYLARQGIHSTIYYPRITLLERDQGRAFWKALYSFKARAQNTIAQILPEPQASLLTGILLGVETGIPADLLEDFDDTGTRHIIAISGFNITVLAGALAAVARRLFSKRASLFIALVGIILYAVLVGGEATVVRAAIMGSLALIAILFGRQAYALTSLAAAAFLMTLIDPFTEWDISSQLSAAATLSLVIFVPIFETWFERLLGKVLSAEWSKAVVRFLDETLIVTLAAQVLTLPLIVHYFKRLSLVSILANVLILPAQPGVMFTGGLATLAGMGWPLAGQILAWIAWLFLSWTIWVVKLTARIPYASVEVGRLSVGLLWLYYGALAMALYLKAQESEQRQKLWHSLTRHLSAKAVLLALAVTATLVWAAVFSLPDGYLHLVFFDVGQGDSIFIVSPGGRQVLVDGGPNPTALLAALGQKMPFWDRSLDVVVATHPDEDHITGLIGVLERYQVGRVLETTLPCETAVARQLADTIQNKNVPVELAQRGMRLRLDEGLWLDVLHPGETLLSGTEADDNNNSIVLRLVYGRASFLLTGDVAEEAERELIRAGQPLQSLVLKVSHHGAKTSSTAPFLEAVRPQVAIIQVGAENRFGHPAPEALKRLENTTLFRTDQQGAVEVVTDGEQYWIGTER